MELTDSLPLENSSTSYGIDFSIHWKNWETSAKIFALKAASCFNEPVCKVREYFYQFYILKETYPETVRKIFQIARLTLGIIVCAAVVPFTAPLGAALRGAVAALQSKPYVYYETGRVGKTLPEDRKITLVSHNQCYALAGYGITDGQVTPPSDRVRMDANLWKIKELNPDIVCLYEVSDIFDACYLSSHLSEYPYIIPVAGMRAIGPTSMIYIASKYLIVEDSIEFIPFIKGTELTGRSQFSEKGLLSFAIRSQGDKKPFTTVVSTHLQHSEIPDMPDVEERISRVKQMEKVVNKIQEKLGQGSVIFTGDLNQNEEELKAFFYRHRIDWLRRDASIKGVATWGGDEWCANLMKRPPSGPQVLDYTFVAGNGTDIKTKIFDVGYCGSEFRPEAASDHNLLFSTITIGKDHGAHIAW
jgi:hypothetical protein